MPVVGDDDFVRLNFNINFRGIGIPRIGNHFRQNSGNIAVQLGAKVVEDVEANAHFVLWITHD